MNYYSSWSIQLSKTKTLDELITRRNLLEHKLDIAVNKHLLTISKGKGKTNRAAHSRNIVGVYREEINAINAAIEIQEGNNGQQ